MSRSIKYSVHRTSRGLHLRKAGAVLLLAAACSAQAAEAPVPAPHFVTIVKTIDVSRPAGAVWAKVGGYCDLSAWLGKSCDIVAGQGNAVGTIRKVDHQIVEILVGNTATSYTYAQPESPGAKAHFYHGTLAVAPLSAQASRITYTLFYDNAAITDPAARQQEYDARAALFQKAIETMKALSEGASKAS